MKLLLDTQILIWLDVSYCKFSDAVRKQVEDPATMLYFSSVSVWEICQKVSRGKLSLPYPPERFIEECGKQYDIEILPFDEKSALALMRLPMLHADPFDRMLICQALEHNLSILTSDRIIRRYPVKTIW